MAGEKKRSGASGAREPRWARTRPRPSATAVAVVVTAGGPCGGGGRARSTAG